MDQLPIKSTFLLKKIRQNNSILNDMLEKFKEFEIKKQEIVFGGTIHETLVLNPHGDPGTDYYDDVTDRWFEICEPIT